MGSLDLQISSQLRTFALEAELSCPPGVLALVGPSGAGKSTVLRAIAGLHKPDSGRIALGDEPWFDSERRVNLAPERRAVGMVFQEYALFPHLTVTRNVAFGGRARVEDLLDRLSISHLAQSRVQEISGGERQRVALARALARDPGVLLLDEPLAALDTHTRAQVRTELGGLLRDFGLPTVLVTHDFGDAAALAGSVAVLVDGTVRQQGTPFELTSAPADPFVASFTGATVVDATVSAAELVFASGARLAAPPDAPEGLVSVAVYPWDVLLAQDGVEATVLILSPHAGATRVETDLLRVDLPDGRADDLVPGSRVRLSVRPGGLRVYPRRLAAL